ncbi:hypothetical protein DC083_04150 [Ignatzschineria ureiclastica]|uniref:Uncharacterized protein n=2 Tax=Ignatzschineria TaxID=112008 RepID=A0A2U2AEN1_9GAMM|nr:MULTISPECIES: hypothetical protein [Ignatzschineria]PWD81100.1 hypothetical protein DC083_04150 [Ignatzschineria ureiclastica]GGZ96229.1 hypothetical protein GCM10007162_10380 [Ignatzschineria ureiclastica]
MKNLVKVAALVVLGAITVGCASQNLEAKADEALRTANEAKSIALATQAQFDKYFTKTRYK